MSNYASQPSVISVGAAQNDREFGENVVVGGTNYRAYAGSGPTPASAISGNVLDAATNAPEPLLRNVRALGGNRWSSVRDVRAWMGVGALVASLPNAIAFALVGVVFAESLAAESGLGALMFNATHTGHAADLMVSAVMLALIGVVLALVIRLLQRALARRLPPEFAVAEQ